MVHNTTAAIEPLLERVARSASFQLPLQTALRCLERAPEKTPTFHRDRRVGADLYGADLRQELCALWGDKYEGSGCA